MSDKFSESPETRNSTIPMTFKDYALLGLSFIPAALFAFGDMIENDVWLRIYTPFFHLSILLLSCYATGKRKPGKTPVFLLACSASLIIFGFFRFNLFLCCANCFIIPMLIALATMSACGIPQRKPLSASGLWEVFVRSVRGLFEYIPLPFSKLFIFKGKSIESVALVMLSLCICFPVLLVVLLLLTSADQIFSSKFENILLSIGNMLDGPFLFRFMLMAAAALMIFSWMFTLRRPAWQMQENEPLMIPPTFPSLLLPMLNAIYALFVYVQFSNLFGSAETAEFAGGYAEYARNGFFELVVVAFINLCVLIVSYKSKCSRWILAMSGILIACTAVILFSAFWRMRLYIAAYGLSVLRALTLWGMLVIAVLLVVSIASLASRKFPAFVAGFTCIIILWVAINVIDLDCMIARYNINGYLSGTLEQIDLEYLQSLSPSAQKIVEDFITN